MKKTNMLFAAVLACLAFAACSEDSSTSSNYTRYQDAVDKEVQSTKKASKKEKAILLVAFGSTWQMAFDAFDATKAAYEAEFTDYDVYLSFSSAICINRAAQGEHAEDGAEVRNYYAPNFWLHAFGTAKYDEILVQSLQVIPGEEFNRVINYLKDFANNYLGDLDDEYLSEVTLKLGSPLLTSAEGEDNDVDAVADALIDYCAEHVAAGKILAFMGHGNPDSYDSYKANVRYTELEEALQARYAKSYVGTVDMPDNYKNNVYDRMLEAGVEDGNIVLYPLMSIAGDHAHNDMAGGEDGEDQDEFWDDEDPESEENSWYMYFTELGGYGVEADMTGLLSIPAVLEVWMSHTRQAVDDEGLEDYYHSMFPEE